MTIDYGSTNGKKIEVWVRISGWNLPFKVGVARVGLDVPTSLRRLSTMLRDLADALDAKADN